MLRLILEQRTAEVKTALREHSGLFEDIAMQFLEKEIQDGKVFKQLISSYEKLPRMDGGHDGKKEKN
jgi:hypothetical protein